MPIKLPQPLDVQLRRRELKVLDIIRGGKFELGTIKIGVVDPPPNAAQAFWFDKAHAAEWEWLHALHADGGTFTPDQSDHAPPPDEARGTKSGAT